MTQQASPSPPSEYRDSVIIGVLGLAVGIFFTGYFHLRGVAGLTFVICMPISFLAIAKGLKFGALVSVVGAAVYGSLVLFKIIQGTAQAGFMREGIVNIAIIIAVGFILGIVSETMKFRDSSIFRQVTTVETFVPDEDTGLYNFKSFRWMLSGEMKRVRRYNSPLSLVFSGSTTSRNFRNAMTTAKRSRCTANWDAFSAG
ncbi:MAG: hypothetical protein M5R36_20345 [Deltaproteobacteria bacterium]|nr:hypothetical protein [Deltaproteobacteria bacterium]